MIFPFMIKKEWENFLDVKPISYFSFHKGLGFLLLLKGCRFFSVTNVNECLECFSSLIKFIQL